MQPIGIDLRDVVRSKSPLEKGGTFAIIYSLNQSPPKPL